MHRVELSLRVKRELDATLAWLVAQSKPGAARWLQQWDEVLVSLAKNPLSSSIAPENDDHAETIRQIIFKTRRGRRYRALFVIRGETVFVTNLRGPGQDFVPAHELP